jgi:hypothetical protein
VQIYVAGDRAYFGTESSDLVGQHARGWDLDCVVPVVVVVAKCVCEVQDRHLADVRRVFSDVEVGRLYTALGDRVGNKEKVELSVNNFTLLNEALINVCALGWVVDEGLSGTCLGLLEESLTDTFVYNDQGDLRTLHHCSIYAGLTKDAILFGDDTVELIKLEVDNLLSHRISDTVTVDENVCGHLSVVEFTVRLE